ncbi:MAG TPA: hypothetical protein VGK87_01435, partial [Anaerolineae bacterium]
RLTGATLGEPTSAETMAKLLTHPEGGMKGIPAGARPVAVLMQRDELTCHPAASSIGDALHAAGYERVIVLSPRARPARMFPLL